MRIIWNEQFKQFEAELTAGDMWSDDQQAVKAAGFLTEGPPEWKWLTFRVQVLNKLKKSAPKSGIRISPEALSNYKRLLAQKEANDEIIRKLKEAKKDVKKDIKKQQAEFQPEIDWENIQPAESTIWQGKYVPPPLPTTLCRVCRIPTYYYESQDPPLCLDCEFAEDF